MRNRHDLPPGSGMVAGGAAGQVMKEHAHRERLWETNMVVREALNQVVEELYARREDVLSMLQGLDRNGTGTLSRQEMQRGLMGMGIRLSPSEMSAIMRAFDRNGDGTVLWHEFCDVLDTWDRSSSATTRRSACVWPSSRHA